MATDYDKTEHAEPAQEMAQVAYGVYADYDGEAPDTATLLFCSTEALAEQVCGLLNKDARKWGGLAFVDGYEWKKRFAHSRVLVPLSQRVPRSLAEVMADVDDPDDDEEFPKEG